MTIQEFISTDPENLIKTSLVTKLTNAEVINYIYNLLDKEELKHYNLEYIVEPSSNNRNLINCRIVHKHSTLSFLKKVNIGRKKYLGLENGVCSIPPHGGYSNCVYVGLDPTSINQGIHISLLFSDGRLSFDHLEDNFLDIIEKLNQFTSKNSKLFERIDSITKNKNIERKSETCYRLFFLLSQAKLQNLENYLTEDTLLELTDSVFWGKVSLKYAGYKQGTKRSSTIIDEQLQLQSLQSYNVRLSSSNYILNYPVKLWKDILDKVSEESKNNLEECKSRLKKAIKLLKKAEEAEKEFYEFVYGPIPETENICPWDFRRGMLINGILHTLDIKGSPLLSKDEQTLRKYFKTVDH